jgi:hypothetical protein
VRSGRCIRITALGLCPPKRDSPGSRALSCVSAFHAAANSNRSICEVRVLGKHTDVGCIQTSGVYRRPVYRRRFSHIYLCAVQRNRARQVRQSEVLKKLQMFAGESGRSDYGRSRRPSSRAISLQRKRGAGLICRFKGRCYPPHIRAAVRSTTVTATGTRDDARAGRCESVADGQCGAAGGDHEAEVGIDLGAPFRAEPVPHSAVMRCSA